MNDIIKKIYDYSLEEIMGERFGRYSKSIIQDRALPDVRDGLKPVQRRILYSMYRDNNTYDHPYQKSARAVGNIMGKYHPHGDSSIYDAMVRMSQWWKSSKPYIEMHGNNGSMDGDSAAAMRYTEARLEKISNELIKDIDKDTVLWAPNYDDSLKEPTVLPAKFPNLLVNGGSGISAGYATNIPPHNLAEIIDATIKRIESPNCYLETILSIVKGPDFPTGGTVYGIEGIKDAFRTGRGKVIIQAKYRIETNKGKKQIIISEIPFDVNKSILVKKIDDINYDKKIEGIIEVRDESDLSDPMRIVIDIKKDANEELIINYLLKNTDLQISFNYNMVAIVNKRPMTLGILEILDAYIAHKKEVVTRGTKFDLDFAKHQMHIVEGMMKALSILDAVIATIRASKNKADAKLNLIEEYGFTEVQAEAIVTLQLYRLTNYDIEELKSRFKNLETIIAGLDKILTEEETLKQVMIDELKKIKKEYAAPRKSSIVDEIVEIKIDTTSLIAKEDVIVVVTNDGYVKRVSTRSYNASDKENPALKEGDFIQKLSTANTLDTVLIFTNMGNYLYIPVYELPDLKWGEIGKHISNIVPITENENIIEVFIENDFKNKSITIFTQDGMVKRTEIEEYQVTRYSKPLTAIKLKENDLVVSVTNKYEPNVLIVTKRGMALKYKVEEIPVTGIRTSGVKAISLKDDLVVSGIIYNNDDYLLVITNKGTAKRIRLADIKEITRAKKGSRIIREVITNPYYVIKSFPVNMKEIVGYKVGSDIIKIKLSEVPIADLSSTGTALSKKTILNAFIETSLEEKEEVKQDISLISIDEQIDMIDSLLKDL